MPHESPQLAAPFPRSGVAAQTRYPDNVATSATTDRILSPATPSLLADYATLFKLRVSTMVIITAAAGFYLGSLRSGISPFHAGLFQALAGIAVVTCGSSALNQALERKTDRLMRRTANRPMAAGRISLAHGLILGFLLVFGGSIYLTLVTNPITGMLTVGSAQRSDLCIPVLARDRTVFIAMTLIETRLLHCGSSEGSFMPLRAPCVH